jgi:hypothetical protein
MVPIATLTFPIVGLGTLSIWVLKVPKLTN